MSKDFPKTEEEMGSMRGSDAAESSFVEGLGQSMRALEVVIRELARSEVPVLLLAEQGAGKQATAERIHQQSGHQDEPFQVVACVDATQEILTANGFGNGLFAAGTVYLEELAGLSPVGQQSLLEVLPEVEGNGHAPGKRARLICGSSRDLEGEVRAGRFREDLYYRISGVCLRLPPLRQRREDIPYLVSFFLAKYARDFRRPVPQLSGPTQQLFQDYAWPGNIRELENAVVRAAAMCDGTIRVQDLPERVRDFRQEATAIESTEEKVSGSDPQEWPSLAEVEGRYVARVLEHTRGNKQAAARLLGVDRKTVERIVRRQHPNSPLLREAS